MTQRPSRITWTDAKYADVTNSEASERQRSSHSQGNFTYATMEPHRTDSTDHFLAWTKKNQSFIMSIYIYFRNGDRNTELNR